MLNRSSDSPGSTIISRRTVAHMALVAVALFWGLNNIVMKIGFREFDPIVFGGLRMLLITLPAILAGRFAPGYQPFVRKDLLAVSGISFVGFSGFLVLFPLGIARVSVPVGGVLMGTMPVWAVLILIAAGMQRISLRALAGVLLTVGGITLIALFGSWNCLGCRVLSVPYRAAAFQCRFQEYLASCLGCSPLFRGCCAVRRQSRLERCSLCYRE